MSYQTLSVSKDWPTNAQFTANGDTQIALTNRSRTPAYYIVNATRPIDDPYGGMAIIHPGKESLTLYDGESLWIAAPGLDEGEVVTDLVFRHY